MSYRIPFNKIGPNESFRQTDVAAAALECISSGQYILGPAVKKFERQLESYYGAYAVGVASGTDALEILLRANRKSGKQFVLTVGNAGRPPISAILRAGLTPIPCDVTLDGLMDLKSLEQRLDFYIHKTAAILPVHLYGQHAPMTEIRALARRFEADVIEDGAQIFGHREAAGCVGSVGMAISFYPTKTLGALGDGGAIITHSVEVARRAEELRFYGAGSSMANADDFGLNSRLDEIQAAILSAQFTSSLAALRRRRELAKMYYKRISKDLLHRDFNEAENFHLFTVIVNNRDKVREYMHRKGIETKVHYPACLSTPSILHTPMTEYLCKSVMSLPLYHSMTEGEVREVSDVLHGACYES